MPNPENSPLLLAPDHEGTEKALTSSKLPGWTILRTTDFENLFYSLPDAISPAPGTRRQAMARSPYRPRGFGQGRRRCFGLERDGKENLHPLRRRTRTTAEIAKLVSDAVGKPISVVQVPLNGLVQGMVGSGMPEVIARVFASFDTNTAAGPWPT